MNRRFLTVASVCILSMLSGGFDASSQTAKSLFWKKDRIQVEEIVSEKADQYTKVGHHGPAVENTYMALRIYFNNSGAIDVYSKTGRGRELEQYGWYPDSLAQAEYGAGCDEYMVGKTVGLGGIALWDGENEVRLVATKGRTARVGDTSRGSFAEMIAYGVSYKGELVDISIRIDMNRKSREALITAKELNGKKVQFLTGVNYHKGESVKYGEKCISVWGIHPADVSTEPVPIGAGMFFSKSVFKTVEKTENMVRIISRPSSQVCTRVVAASTKEAELNSARRFDAYMGLK